MFFYCLRVKTNIDGVSFHFFGYLGKVFIRFYFWERQPHRLSILICSSNKARSTLLDSEPFLAPTNTTLPSSSKESLAPCFLSSHHFVSQKNKVIFLFFIPYLCCFQWKLLRKIVIFSITCHLLIIKINLYPTGLFLFPISCDAFKYSMLLS